MIPIIIPVGGFVGAPLWLLIIVIALHVVAIGFCIKALMICHDMSKMLDKRKKDRENYGN